jgi:hypothetical protein
MHHFSRALATARIDDLHRAAAQMRTIGLARSATQDPHVALASHVAIRRWMGRRAGGPPREPLPLPREMRSQRS